MESLLLFCLFFSLEKERKGDSQKLKWSAWLEIITNTCEKLNDFVTVGQRTVAHLIIVDI